MSIQMAIEIIGRKDARAIGLSTYFLGAPCTHGHIAERYSSDGRCVECSRLRGQKFRAKYDKEIKESQRKWRTENSDKIKSRLQKWCVENPKKNSARFRKWAIENQEKRRESAL